MSLLETGSFADTGEPVDDEILKQIALEQLNTDHDMDFSALKALRTY